MMMERCYCFPSYIVMWVNEAVLLIVCVWNLACWTL